MMTANIPVKFDELLQAFDWVNSATYGEMGAFVSRQTGQIYLSTNEIDLEVALPEDIEDEEKYLAVPNKQELDLGKNLVLSFTAEHLPEASASVADFFRQRGAYGRFKALLESRGQLQTWYDYEAQETARTLREWCFDQGLSVAEDASRKAG